MKRFDDGRGRGARCGNSRRLALTPASPLKDTQTGMRTRLVALLVLFAAALFLAPSTGSAATAERCAAKKLGAAGRKTTGLLKCQAQALQHDTAVDPACVARVVDKFAASWARIEARGACATVGDLENVEAQVDALVASLAAALSPPLTTTSTTTTPTSTCPPTTALYCGISACGGPGPQALCPAGMSCSTPEEGCRCEGPATPCGDLIGAFCRWGSCPTGLTCQSDPGSSSCPPACSCQ